MSKKFDPTKPVQTRNGNLARIICTDKEAVESHNFPIVALIKSPTDIVERIEVYTKEGYYSNSELEHSADLINIPEEKVGWINIYSSAEINYTYVGKNIYETKEESEKGISPISGYTVHTVQVTWKE